MLETAVELRRAAEPFVLATVVRADRPTSAKPGAKAIVTADGRLIGWVGGSCARPTVLREAKKALARGRPHLVRLSPPESLGEEAHEGLSEVPLTCVSGGTLEIYLEPYQPRPHLILIGHLPVVESLLALAKPLGYRVTVMSPEVTAEQFAEADEVRTEIGFEEADTKGECFIVVASHGNYDEEGLESALGATESGYLALVASPRRAGSMREELARSGLSEEALSRVKSPAGLDIGASTPEEIALSILAEIVSLRRRDEREPAPPATEPATERDPICGMTVEREGARYTLERSGRRWYFCSSGCRRSFQKQQEASSPVER